MHDFSGVVAETDYRIRAERARMFEHSVQGIAPRLLTEIGENGNVPADQSLEAGADGSKNRAGPDNDSSHHSEGFHGALAVERKSGGRHGWVHELSIGSVPAEFQPPICYREGVDCVFAGGVFTGDLRSLLLPNKSPMSKKLM
jgi:hypothetical protein